MRLAATEVERFRTQLERLPDAAWSRPTACPGWDVQAMTGHVVGMTKMPSTIRENVRQLRAAMAATKREGGLVVDHLAAMQVREHAHLSPAALIEELAAVGPAGVQGRARTPALIRWLPMPGPQPVDDTGSVTEPWAVGFLVDTILTRDTWMHRSDIAEAAGIAMELTPDHDGVLVADVAAEWANRHGQPCTLTLSGPAGGTWGWGSGGSAVELDAVEFCRVVSGRGRGDGLLATRVPF
jgi:uncharacterized protein (TIGR03083 family)